MKIGNARNLLSKYVHGETLMRHSLTVSAVLRHFAELTGESDPEFWECVGLLHDIDFEQYPDAHCVKAREILESEKAAFPEITEELIHAVVSHGWNICSNVEPVLPMEKILYAVDELTGLIYASAMMRPSKSVMDMEVKSVMKKFKTPAFAAGCNREIISAGVALTGMSLETITEECIQAMRKHAHKLGV
jgi:predicted hydrolase (HD superfamily)